MKTKKLLTFLFLTLLCVVGMSAKAEAATTGSCGNTSEYSYNTSTKTLTISGTGSVSKNPWKSDYQKVIQKVVIEEGITGIGTSIFSGHTAITSVTLPESLTELGYFAFENCTALKSIMIPKNVTKTGGSMGQCFKGSGVTTVTFAEGATTVPTYMFKGCTTLTTVNFSQNIKTIGTGAFSGCTSLASVTLPESLTELGYFAFENCTALKSITIPKNVTKTGGSMGQCFKGSGVTTVTFAEGATTVPTHMFKGCTTLTTVNFSQNIKTIGTGAFSGCTGLTELTLPWYLESIGYLAFENCTNLKSVTIYQKCNKIDNAAFKSLTGLTICGKKNTKAQTFASKNKYAFKTCKIPALKGITYKNGNLKYTVVTDYINGKGTVCVTGMVKNASSVTIPNTVKLESYNYKVVKINSKAFCNKSKLKKVTIKATNITSIGSKAFSKINKKAVITVPKKKYSKYSKMLKKAGVKSPMKIKKK